MQFLVGKELGEVRWADFTQISNSDHIEFTVNTEFGRKQKYCVFLDADTNKLAACSLKKFHKTIREEVHAGDRSTSHVTTQKLVNSALLAEYLPVKVLADSIANFDKKSLESLFLELKPKILGKLICHLYTDNSSREASSSLFCNLTQDEFYEWMKSNIENNPRIVANIIECAETKFIDGFFELRDINSEQYLIIVSCLEPKDIRIFLSKTSDELNVLLFGLTASKFIGSKPDTGIDAVDASDMDGEESIKVKTSPEEAFKKSLEDPNLIRKRQLVLLTCLVENLPINKVTTVIKHWHTESLALLLNTLSDESCTKILDEIDESRVCDILQNLTKGARKESNVASAGIIEQLEIIDFDDTAIEALSNVADTSLPVTVEHTVMTKAAQIICCMKQEQFVKTFKTLEPNEIANLLPLWGLVVEGNANITRAQCDALKSNCSKLGKELAENYYNELILLLDSLNREYLVAFVAHLDAKMIAKLACEVIDGKESVLMKSGKPLTNFAALCDILVNEAEMAEQATDVKVGQGYIDGMKEKSKIIRETARHCDDIDNFSKCLSTNLLKIKSETRVSALLNSFDEQNDRELFSLVMKEMMLSENFEHILSVINGLDTNHKKLFSKILSDEDIIKIATTMSAENIIEFIKILPRDKKVELITKITTSSSQQNNKFSKFCMDSLAEKNEKIIEFFIPETLITLLSSLDTSLSTVDNDYLLKIILGSTKHSKTPSQTLRLLPPNKSVDLILLYVEHHKTSSISGSESVHSLAWSQELINHLGGEIPHLIDKLTQKGFVRESLAVCDYLEGKHAIDALKCIFQSQQDEQFKVLVDLLTGVSTKVKWRDWISKAVSQCDVEILRKFFSLGNVKVCLMLTKKVDEQKVIEAFENLDTLNRAMYKIMSVPNIEVENSLEASVTSQMRSLSTQTASRPLTNFLQNSKVKVILWCIANQNIDTSQWIDALNNPDSWIQKSINTRSSKSGRSANKGTEAANKGTEAANKGTEAANKGTEIPRYHLLTATLAEDGTSLGNEESLRSAVRGCKSSEREMWLKAMSPSRRTQVMLLLNPNDAGEMLIKFHGIELSKMFDCEQGKALLKHIKPNEEPLLVTHLTDSLPSDSSSRSRTLTLRRGQVQISEHSWNTLKSIPGRLRFVEEAKGRSMSFVSATSVVKSQMTNLLEQVEISDLALIIYRMEPQAAYCLLEEMNVKKAQNVSIQLINNFYSNMTDSNVVDLSLRVPPSILCSLYNVQGFKFSQFVNIVERLMNYAIEAIGSDVDNGVIVVVAVEEIFNSLSVHEITTIIQTLTNQTDNILSFCEKPDEIAMKFDGEMWGKLISALSPEAFKDIVNLSSQAKAQAVLANFRLDSVNYLFSLYVDNLDTRSLILNNIKIEVLTDYIKEKFAQGQKIDETLTLLSIDNFDKLLFSLKKVKTNKPLIKQIDTWKKQNKE